MRIDGIGRAAAALALSVLVGAAAEPERTTAWFAIYAADGQLIGRQHDYDVALAHGVRHIVTRELAFTVDGHPPTRLTTRIERNEDADGQTRSYRIEQGGVSTSILIEPGATMVKAVVTRTGARSRQHLVIELPPGVRFEDGPIAADGGAFERFDPVALVVERVTFSPAGGADARQVIRKGFDGEPLRSIALIDVDAAGQLQAVTQPMFGSRVTIRRVATPVPDAALSPKRTIPHESIAASYRLGRAALAGRIRYRFGFGDGLRFDLPQTGEQRTAAAGDGVQVDICTGCGPGLSTAPEDLARWTRPSAWMQADDAVFRAAARDIAGRRMSDRDKIAALAVRARARLAIEDFAGHVSALEAWQRRSGDCTEDAAVLATLARAAGIPALVANGLVYTPQRYHGVTNAFVPHSWTLAYADGAWRSFDMSVGGFDASHIALTVGEGDARSVGAANQLAGVLLWQSMAEVRPQAAR